MSPTSDATRRFPIYMSVPHVRAVEWRDAVPSLALYCRAPVIVMTPDEEEPVWASLHGPDALTDHMVS